MAEGGLGEGLFGGEGEERDAEFSRAGPDAIAAAVAMDAARFDPELARQAAEYLAKQGRLTDLQLHHFDEERRLAIAAARRKSFADRIRNGLLGGTALVVIGTAAVVIKIAWDAARSHDLVVEAFATPPDLVAQGLTGKVIASQLEDRLNALQAETVSSEDTARASGGAEAAVTVKVLETEVSLGEVAQTLRQWLGHETRVSGEIVHTPDRSGEPGLALTVRVGDEPGEEVAGPVAGVHDLIQTAAERVYAAASPFRYVDFLTEHGRDAEAETLLRLLAKTGTNDQRRRADVRLGASSSHLPFRQRESFAREAARLDPTDYEVRRLLSSIESSFGHIELALKLDTEALEAPVPRNYSNVAKDVARYQIRFVCDTYVGDYIDALAVSDEDAAHRAGDPNEWQRQASAASVRVGIHDLAAVRRYVAAGFADDPALSTASRARREQMFLVADGQLEMATGDWLSAIARVDRISALDRDGHADRPTWPQDIRKAYALARLGRLAEADGLVATTPLDCYDCVTVRAQIADIKGDHAAADRWFAEALRQGPSLPFAETLWGDTLLARGQPDLAVEKYTAAHAKGPKFADPLKGWGDALARKGEWRAALAKYGEALRDAPAWVELRTARDAAARRVG